MGRAKHAPSPSEMRRATHKFPRKPQSECCVARLVCDCLAACLGVEDEDDHVGSIDGDDLHERKLRGYPPTLIQSPHCGPKRYAFNGVSIPAREASGSRACSAPGRVTRPTVRVGGGGSGSGAASGRVPPRCRGSSFRGPVTAAYFSPPCRAFSRPEAAGQQT